MSTIHISMCSPVLIRLYTHVFTYVCMYVHMCTLFNTCSLARLNTEHLYVYMFTVHMFPCGTPFSYPNPCSKHKAGIGGIHSHMVYLSIYVHMSRINTYTRLCVFTGHTNTCTSDHCTPVCISGVHPFCHVHNCSYVHVSTCTYICMYICSYTHMRTCT